MFEWIAIGIIVVLNIWILRLSYSRFNLMNINIQKLETNCHNRHEALENRLDSIEGSLPVLIQNQEDIIDWIKRI